MAQPNPQQGSQPASSSPAPYITALIGLYGWAEQALLGYLSRLLRTATPDAAGVRDVTIRSGAAVRQVLAVLEQRTPQLVAAITNLEAGDGSRAGTALIQHGPAGHGPHSHGPSGGGGTPPPPSASVGFPGDEPFDLSITHPNRAAQAVADDLTSELEDVRRRITRLPDDVYKAIGPQGGVLQVLNNGLTDQQVIDAHPDWTWAQVDAEIHRVHSLTAAQAQAVTWRRFVARGVTGFTDKSGRDWSLSAYVEMAVRTAAARAYRDSHMQVMRVAGVHYFTVPPHTHTCPQCFPWQHTVIAEEDDGSGFPTLDEAIAAGLFHPNCRCTLVPWFPNVSPHPDGASWTPADAARYAASQKQRALEREVRKAKAAADHALTPEARSAARRDVRTWQGRIRDHLTQHPGLPRQYRRERPHLGMDSIALPPAPQ